MSEVEELDVNLYIRDSKGKKYRDSDNKEIDHIHHKVIKTQRANIERYIKKKYDIYKTILKEGCSIEIEILEKDIYSRKVLYSYDGEKLRTF